MSPSTPSRIFSLIVSPEEFVAYEKKTFQALRADLSLPGFRRGNVPDTIARQHISSERMFQEAVSLAVAERSSATLRNLHEEFVGEPKVEILKAAPGDPLEFRITVEVLPTVDILGWRTLRILLKPKPVEQQEVEGILEQLQRSRTKLRAVLRPAAKGDVVEVDFSTSVDGVPLEGGSAKKQPIVLGDGGFVPGFQETVVGMSVGEERRVTLVFPQDWPVKHLAGKKGAFTIQVHNVQERLVPELDDVFAQSLGHFQTLDALKANIRENLAAEHKEGERRRVRTEAVDRLGEHIISSALPEALIAQEIARMREELRSSVESSGISFEDHLARLGKQQEELSSDLREGAIRRVKAALVLRTLAKQEDIRVSEKETETRMQEILEAFRHDESAPPRIDSQQLRRYTEKSLRNEKVMDLIERIVTSE